tara:strand:- start:119 stop:829 length:711 start_codon:yes stop_codon:yes gene_type:complete
MKYSIIIPIYKEKKNLPKLTKILSQKLNSYKRKYEIIFVDDDSRDGSAEIYKKIKTNKTKFYTRIKKPRDLSMSVVYGFSKAKYNNIAVMDGDLQHRPSDLLKLMKIFEKNKYEIVIGSRKLDSFTNTNLNPLRFYMSKFLNLITNLIFAKKLIDPMSGFFVIRKDVFLKSKKNLFLKGYKILLDIILSSPNKIKFKEIYIKFKSREKGFSKMRFKILFQLFLFLIFKFLSKKTQY